MKTITNGLILKGIGLNPVKENIVIDGSSVSTHGLHRTETY